MINNTFVRNANRETIAVYNNEGELLLEWEEGEDVFVLLREYAESIGIVMENGGEVSGDFTDDMTDLSVVGG